MHARLTRRLGIDGVEPLSDTELLAIACGVSLDRARSWIDDPSAERLVALRALGRRLDARVDDIPVVTSARDAAALLHPLLASSSVEEMYVLALDSRNRLLRRQMIARGGVNQVAIAAREVFRPLVHAGAARAIVAHNHPSGDPSPSAEDRDLTVRLGVAGELIGVPIVDHLVIAQAGYFSFAEDGGALPIGVRRARDKKSNARDG